MKLEEAASILGVSLEDITIDGLKQTYKKLALAWDPEKCKDQNSKSKYLQISEAYKKLNSVMEGTDGYKGDDSHEIAAFMRMFMDMVGISESDSIPAAMTFGMMFGANQTTVEEWSTDEDGEGDYDDDEDDDEIDDEEDEDEYLPDEYFEEYAHPSSHLHAGATPAASCSIHAAIKGKLNHPPSLPASWEPQVKQYSNMNLKDQLNQERMQMQHEMEDQSDNDEGETGELTEQEKERKLKLAKKRAEKRKKQKEKDKKKSKEQNASLSEHSPGDYVINIKDFLDDAELNPSDLKKLIRFHTDHIITELMHAVTNGQLGRVNQILSYDFNEDVPAAVASVITLLREQLPSTPVLHHCITNLSRVTSVSPPTTTPAQAESSSSSAANNTAAYNTAMFTALAARRLEVARYLLGFNQPAFELATVDSAGLSVLHSAIVNGDLKIAQLVIKAIGSQSTEGRKGGQLNINSRCHRQGWAPIHYAVERGDVEAVRLLAQNGANILVTMATDKRQTPLELARLKLKTSNAAGKPAMQAVVDELVLTIERNKTVKELENKAKRAEIESKSANKGGKDKKSSNNANTIAEGTVETVAKPAIAVPIAPASIAAPTPDKKKDKKKNKEKEKQVSAPAVVVSELVKSATEAAPASSSASAKSTPPAAAVTAPASATKGKKGKKDKAQAAATAASSAPSIDTQPINPIVEMSVSSRDEMVDRLLAMGFREADCLHAISLYGTDFDQAIGWLCERPAASTPTSSKVAEVEPPRPVDSSPASSGHMTLAAAMAAGAAMSSPAAPSSAVKLQKEKEELRRINRAWNAKAEDEKRKAEALRKQAEIEKQQELLAQKQQLEQQRLQQAQQEYMYQQHLQQQQQQQQYMTQHHHPVQTQQQGFYGSNAHGSAWTPQQQQQMYGGSDATTPAYAGGNTSSFPIGSLQHMSNVLAAPQQANGSGGAGFGSHPNIASVSASVSAAPPSLQTLASAMAMVRGDSQGPAGQPLSGLYGGSSALGGGFPSSSMGINDVMGLAYKSPTGSDSSSFGGGGASSSLLYKESPKSSGWGVDSIGGDMYNVDAEHEIVDGALELSAVAKPFVPRFGSSALGGGGSTPTTGSAALLNTSSPLSSAFGGPLSSSALGGLSLSSGLSAGLSGGLSGSPWGSSASLNIDSVKNTDVSNNNISSYLSNLLSSDLNLDEDNYEYGDASNIIPDLDSFLLNDN